MNKDNTPPNTDTSSNDNDSVTKHTEKKDSLIELMDYTQLPDSNIDVDVLLGTCDISFHSFLRLVKGDILALDKQAGDGVDIFTNDRIIGIGGVQVINGKFSIRIEDSMNLHNIVDYLHDEQYVDN
jgi:flagellar motor switch protein FliN/FliY